MRFGLVAVLTCLTSAEAAISLNDIQPSPPRVAKPERTVSGRYVALLDEAVLRRSRTSTAILAENLANDVGVTVGYVFTDLITGFSFKDANEAAVQELLANEIVSTIFPDTRVYLAGGNQTEYLPWGLDRIDDPIGLDGSFQYPDNPGEGVDIYIIDTGINAFHEDFAGRLAPENEHFNMIEDDFLTPRWNDCLGHGTHIASTAAGTKYGVAKSATLHAVRVFDCNGEAFWSTIVSSMGLVARQCQLNGKKCVVNMSFYGEVIDFVNLAAQAMIDMGIVVVAAAGNDGDDACFTSPASVDKVIAVGATTIDDVIQNASNYGPCVDIFAPGEDILGAGIDCTDCTDTYSGTSSATPYVSGVAALILQDYASQDYIASPSDVAFQLVSDAVEGVIQGIGENTSNFLLQMNTPFVSYPPSSAPTGTPQPTNVASVEPTSAPTDSQMPSQMPSVLTCEDGLSKVEVKIETDEWGGETYFTLIDTCKQGEVLMSVLPLSLDDYSSYSFTTCVGFGRFELTFSDSYGDGLLWPSHYQLLVDGEEVAYGFNFGFLETTVFGDDDCITPAPTSSSSPTTAPSESFQPTESKMPSASPTSPMPSLVPSSAPSVTPSVQPTFFECPGDLVYLTLEILTDEYAEEISIVMYDNCNGDEILNVPSGFFENSTLYNGEWCLEPHQHTVYIEDTAEDGIFSPGYIQFWLDRELILDNPSYDSGYTFSFLEPSNDCEDPLVPTPAPTPVVCEDDEIELVVELLTDDFSYETALVVENLCNDRKVLEVEGIDLDDLEYYSFKSCVGNEQLRLVVYDSWGDGIFDPGYLRVTFDGELIVDNPLFESSYTMEFGDTCAATCPCDQRILGLRIACKLRHPLTCILSSVPFLPF